MVFNCLFSNICTSRFSQYLSPGGGRGGGVVSSYFFACEQERSSVLRQLVHEFYQDVNEGSFTRGITRRKILRRQFNGLHIKLSELTLRALLRKSLHLFNAGQKIGKMDFKNITVSYSNINYQYNIPLFIHLYFNVYLNLL